MSQAAKFLNSVAHAFSTMGLYGPRHPARREAVDDMLEELRALLRDTPNPVFCFLNHEVVYRDRPLRELKAWAFGRRLSESKIQRLEFTGGVSREELESFLEEITARLQSDGANGSCDEMWAADHVKFGPIKLPDEVTGDLAEAIESVDLLHADAASDGKVSESLARGVVHTLTQAMRYGRRLLVPLVPLKRNDQYTTVHSINSSILAMGLAEFLHFGGGDVRRIGEAALLHDVGKIFTPQEIVAKPGALTPEEWEIIKRHPVDGARILLKSGNNMELAATVAYEHHVGWQGHGGYPTLRYNRRLHPASRLIQICDVYDACRTRRPFREPLPADEVVRFLKESAGDKSDPQLTAAFIEMMQAWDSRVVTVGEE